MTSIAVVPGSFDPVTLGQISIIERAASIFDDLRILVVSNEEKDAFLSLEQRVALLDQSVATAGLTNVTVSTWGADPLMN